MYCIISPQIKIHTEILRDAGDISVSSAIPLRHRSHYVLETIFWSLFSFLVLLATLVYDALKSPCLLRRKITLGLVCSTHISCCIWCWNLMDVFPFSLPSRWIAAVNVSGAQVKALHLHAVLMVFNPILCTAFKECIIFLFKSSWLNPRINVINSACVEVEQLAAWYCPGGFNLIFLFSKSLCASPLSTQPTGLCREKCGMWGWLPLPCFAFEPLLWGLFIESFWGKKVTGELWCQVQNKTAAISLDTVPLKCQIVNFLRGRMSFLGIPPGVKESQF